MSRAAIALLLIAGCAPVGGRLDRAAPPPPGPGPADSAIATSASEYAKALPESLAVAAEEMAGSAEQYTDWEDYFAAWGEKNESARKAIYKKTGEAINAATGEKYSPAEAASAAREVAKGLRQRR